jgi:glycosyltransferase involved in cell wall biosynthesis
MTTNDQPGRSNHVAVVIPALNEARAISEVIAGVGQYGVPIVVDDGSTDETAQLAERGGAIVVKHAVTRGYDKALESGLFKAIELGFDYAVTLDADGQHFPQTILRFETELSNSADLVIGYRDRHQRLAESAFAILGKALWGMADPLCGMKGYKLCHLEKLGHFDSYRSIGTEFAIRCARSRLDLRYVPVPTRDRSGRSRFGSGFRANYKIFRAMLIGLFRATSF